MSKRKRKPEDPFSRRVRAYAEDLLLIRLEQEKIRQSILQSELFGQLPLSNVDLDVIERDMKAHGMMERDERA